MPIRAQDVLPLGEAHSRLAELAEDAAAGAEKVLTKDGLPYIAIIDARRLDYYHALEAGHRRLLMLDDASKGLHNVLAGRVQTETQFIGAHSASKLMPVCGEWSTALTRSSQRMRFRRMPR